MTMLRHRSDRAAHRWVLIAVALPLTAIYLATATLERPYHIDPLTNALTSWSVAASGTPYLDDYTSLTSQDYFGNIGWLVLSHGRPVAQYPPGAALLAVPFYVIHPTASPSTLTGTNNPEAAPVPVPFPSLVPAAVATALATALAMGLLAVTFLSFTSPSVAIGAAYIAGLGTGAWSVASDSLWQHGPAMLWIALGLYLLSRQHHLPAGLAFGMAILTRPHTALIAATAGIWIGASKRSLKPVLLVGLGSTVGLATLIGYNWAIFGTPSISGGYGDAFTTNALHSGLWWYLKNITGALLDPERGLLIWAPFLLVLLPGLPTAWKSAPGWVKGSAIGGLLYLLVQLKANRYSGGSGFFAYRYPLETLTATAPLLVLTWKHWISQSRPRSWLLLAGVVFAILTQAVGAIA